MASPRASVERVRCGWVGDDPLAIAYHDEEWGVPSFDDRHLFEMLVLEGAQAGLSWATILRKREGYRKAFANFDAAKVARFDARKKRRLLDDPGIVRNRLKVESAIENARRVLEVRRSHGSLSRFLWQFVDHRTIRNHYRHDRDAPAETEESRCMSRELKKLGFRFVGPTICYAFMQAVGMVDDHESGCFRRIGRS